MVERLPYKQDVTGSSPVLPIHFCKYYFLSLDFSFVVFHHVLGILKAKNSLIFNQYVAKKEMKRLMLVPDSLSQMHELMKFDKDLTMETID